MRPAAVVAAWAESVLGSGEAAVSAGPVGARAQAVVATDERLQRAGLAKPVVMRAAAQLPPGVEPARALIERAAAHLAEELDARRPGWRSLRLGLAVGTSSGGLVALSDALAVRARGDAVPRALAEATPYFGPVAHLPSVLGATFVERVQVLAACASSGIAIGLATRWLDHGHVDLVIAGGYDAVSTFVAAGFESLGATTAREPSPFRAKRDGMILGEAAALVALVRAEDAPAALGYVRGFTASSDAVHISAPDPEGAGLARAAASALADGATRPDEIDLVSAHATATPLNDSAEARTLHAVLGPRAEDVPVHPLKAVVGHTLGAGAALELLSALHAMRHGVLPAAAGQGELGPDIALRLLERNEAGRPSTCLKLSAAFGGVNAAIVASLAPGEGRPLPRRAVSVLALGEPRTAADASKLAGRVGISPVHLARLDPLSGAVVAAGAAALESLPPLVPERSGLVVGTIAATLEVNEAFESRLRERGGKGAEPRRFMPTSPNTSVGQGSIALGIRGPSFAVGSGVEAPLEALLAAHDLIAAGDADTVVVVAADDVGPVVRDLFAAAGLPLPEAGGWGLVLGHSDLAPLERARLAALVEEARASGDRPGGTSPGWPALKYAAERHFSTPQT